MAESDERRDDGRPLSVAESEAEREAASEADRRRESGTPLGRRGRGGRGSAESAETIEAETVNVHQGGAQQIVAYRIDIRQGGAARAEASEISVRQGGIGLAKGDRISIEMGAIGAALGGQVDVRQGMSRLTAARESVRMEQSGSFAVLANRVEMARQSGVVFLFAREVQGDVRALFDWRAGAAFGAAAGLVAVLARGIRGRRR